MIPWKNQRPWKAIEEHLVEVPGTAPGSDRFITAAIYRHSRPFGQQSQYSIWAGILEAKFGKYFKLKYLQKQEMSIL
jgi:hypothetical protein